MYRQSQTLTRAALSLTLVLRSRVEQSIKESGHQAGTAFSVSTSLLPLHVRSPIELLRLD